MKMIFARLKTLKWVVNLHFSGNTTERIWECPRNIVSISFKQTNTVNLAALDCYATIEGTRSPYQKTYQDKLDVNCLVDDVFQKDKSFNLDKIFDE